MTHYGRLGHVVPYSPNLAGVKSLENSTAVLFELQTS